MWRLFTNFFFFGSLSVDFLFHMFFLVRHCLLTTYYLLLRVVLYCRTDYSLVMSMSATAACYCPLLSATASHSSSTDDLAY